MSGIKLSTPGTNAAGKRIVDLLVDGTEYGYIVLNGGCTVEQLADALDAMIVGDSLPRISDMVRNDDTCEVCKGHGMVCENHPDKPWGGVCCSWHDINPDVCEHGACACGAGTLCPACTSQPTKVIRTIEEIKLDAVDVQGNIQGAVKHI